MEPQSDRQSRRGQEEREQSPLNRAALFLLSEGVQVEWEGWGQRVGKGGKREREREIYRQNDRERVKGGENIVSLAVKVACLVTCTHEGRRVEREKPEKDGV